VNVTINGIPYNDSESQGTFWVNISDIASSTQSVQIQRGVGTSTNGAGAFGASVNLQTTTLQSAAYAEVQASAGSFQTRRLTVKAGTGLLHNQWAFDGRVSSITSAGYVDRASADLNSYYFSGGYYGKKTILKGIVFGGHEVTYQAWYGVDEATLRQQRTFNYAGALYDADYNVTGYYDNEVDNYRQDHSQLHFTHQFSDRWNAHAALHYTYGRGYFEQYKQQESFADLGLPDIVLGDTTLESSDVIVRRWLQNDFYGLTFSTQYAQEKWNAILGGAVNTYTRAGHFGEIIWAQHAANSTKDQRYYDGESDKDDANFYLKSVIQFTDRLSGYADAQYRWVSYRTEGVNDDQSAYRVNDRFGFFNPKFGFTYQSTPTQQWYASLAWANREPNRSDYLDNEVKPKPERLINAEAGWRKNNSSFALEINTYYMHYKDQLVLTGEINNSGYPVRANIGKSYRTGLEAAGKWRVSEVFSVQATATISQNKNVDFVQVDENNAVTTATTDIILSPRFAGAWQVSWCPFRHAEIAWLSKYVGGQYLDNTQNSAFRLEPYAVQDIRITYSRPIGNRMTEVSLLANNVLDAAYESNGYVYEGTPYYFPQAGRHFLVMVSFRF
jgi:iron complex outermembrane receptor protein